MRRAGPGGGPIRWLTETEHGGVCGTVGARVAPCPSPLWSLCALNTHPRCGPCGASGQGGGRGWHAAVQEEEARGPRVQARGGPPTPPSCGGPAAAGRHVLPPRLPALPPGSPSLCPVSPSCCVGACSLGGGGAVKECRALTSPAGTRATRRRPLVLPPPSEVQFTYGPVPGGRVTGFGGSQGLWEVCVSLCCWVVGSPSTARARPTARPRGPAIAPRQLCLRVCFPSENR